MNPVRRALPGGSAVCKAHLRPRRCYAFAAQSNLRTALFFPGHGVQRVGMTKAWVEAYPTVAKPFLEETDEILKIPLSRIIDEGPVNKLNETEYAQPGIMATSTMILRVLEKEYGFKTTEKIDVTLGHSLGEYAALVVGGYLKYPDAMRMIRRRAEIMAECTRQATKESGNKYGMMALICEDERLESLIATIHQFVDYGSTGAKTDSHEVPAIDQVLIANINSKTQIVLSGSFERIKQLLVQIREFGGHDPRAVEIKSNSPFHSPIMIPAMQYMRETLKTIPVKFPAIMPCISNVSGRPFQSEDDLKDLLSRQAIETVQWWNSIKYLDQTAKVKRWLGIGPGKVGRNLVGKEVGRSFAKGGGVWAISDPREVESTLRALEETEAEDV